MGLFSLTRVTHDLYRNHDIVPNTENEKSDKWLCFYGVDGMYNILTIKIYPPQANLEHKVRQCISYDNLQDLTLDMLKEIKHFNYKKPIRIYEDYKIDDYIDYNIDVIQEIYPEEFI
jgi:hypothetical protein